MALEEAVAPYLLERPSPASYKQAKISNNSNPFKFKSTGNLIPCNIHGGLLPPPPSRFLSGSSFLSHQYYHPFIHMQQPPLLPSPSPSPLLQRSHRTLSSQSRSQSLNPIKKSKSTKKEQEPKQDLKTAIDHRHTWKNRLSNRKSDPAGDVFKFSSESSTSSINKRVVRVQEIDKLSGYLFTLSPPPSSLPLPKFSLRPPKLSCNAEAAGVDPGATDDLRRLLRLP